MTSQNSSLVSVLLSMFILQHGTTKLNILSSSALLQLVTPYLGAPTKLILQVRESILPLKKTSWYLGTEHTSEDPLSVDFSNADGLISA